MRRPAETFDAIERTMWDGRAEAYAASFARLCAYPVGALLDAAEVTAGTYLLDAGTGTGTAAMAARRRGARVRAVDADAGMVAAARAAGVDARLAALPELPFADGEFDAVVANFVLNHVGRPRAALAELRRVLRPGSRLVLTLWSARRGAGQDLLVRACEAGGAVPPAGLPRRDPAEDFARTPEGLAELLEEAAFTAVESTELEWDHRATVEEWWGGAAAGVATIGLVVTSQEPETVVRIRQEYERLSGEFADGGGRLALPHVALLAHARA
ncbi:MULTISPECIES: class I SAM-dependent methyltransferase [unclassified Streptomyces]|uniref:class I SAM-dependent methyltransferase n=1 Tax=unclassified Streptomyces TaxID=2593676 RepID=UPI002E82298C|nr:class I SAM-dependent methyltransferase [Streptomyces sp. NBC_00589]WTI38727.1 class I SAM-dependent methyltransferase [Streptomyces sp. NBC_00775]WUB27593.1 class I SAM-dependent methyltransferase [Streptomyces sp. NBC_00589]